MSSVMEGGMIREKIKALFEENEYRYWGPGHVRVLLSEIDRLEASLHQAEERVKELEGAIKEVLADEESGKGWGPDVTMVGVLKEALKEQP